MTRADRLLTPLAAAVAAADGYILLLAAAAAAGLRRGPAAARSPGEFRILIPAHDEEATLPRLFDSLDRLEQAERAEVIVIADNCSDGTARIARERGADVLERHDPANPGKGQAIAWALAGLEEGGRLDRPVVFVDADCEVSPNLLTAFEARFAAGARAAQADYVVSNPEASDASAVRAAAFSLINTVRPAGRSALGLSCGLLGTGMAFHHELLRTVPWQDFGLAEDLEYALRLADAGERVVFVPEASVRSPMPTSDEGAREQQLRWEGGKLAAARAWAPRLIRDGLTRRDPVRLAAGAETLVPPQTALAAANLAVAAMAGVSGARTARRLTAAGLAAQVAYVVGGLALVRAPAAVWRGLLQAPASMLAKLPLLGRVAFGSRPDRWVRTAREEPGQG